MQPIYKISYDNLTIMPKLRLTYDERLIYKTAYELWKAFCRYESLAIPHHECRRGAYLPSLGREPGVDKPLKSVTHDQCDARPTVTFPAAGHHRPLTGTNHTAW